MNLCWNYRKLSRSCIVLGGWKSLKIPFWIWIWVDKTYMSPVFLAPFYAFEGLVGSFRKVYSILGFLHHSFWQTHLSNYLSLRTPYRLQVETEFHKRHIHAKKQKKQKNKNQLLKWEKTCSPSPSSIHFFQRTNSFWIQTSVSLNSYAKYLLAKLWKNTDKDTELLSLKGLQRSP